VKAKKREEKRREEKRREEKGFTTEFTEEEHRGHGEE
jgi:hypothetical protein